jgi:hypothetical protein
MPQHLHLMPAVRIDAFKRVCFFQVESPDGSAPNEVGVLSALGARDRRKGLRRCGVSSLMVIKRRKLTN